MKKLFYGLLIFFGLIMAISYGVSRYPTFTISGKEFLGLLANNQYSDSYEMLTDETQKQITLDDFTLMMKQIGLDKYRSVKWVKTYVDKEAGVASVLGVVSTVDGKSIPVQIRFVRVAGSDWTEQAWRISEIRTHANASEGLY